MNGHDHHHEYGPSGVGTVMLDIGADTGALIIYTGPECLGLEIEISPAGAHGPPRTHAAVRERHLPEGVVHCAVYDALPEGQYAIWRDAALPAGSVHVPAAGVAEFDWPPS